MNFIYSQSEGIWKSSDLPTSLLIPACYSGNGIYRNDPNSEGVAMHGPIPHGTYILGPLEPTHPVLGIDVIHLTPDPGTAAYITNLGRQDLTFYIHGDNPAHPGQSSDGCIVMGHFGRLSLKVYAGSSVQVVPSFAPLAVS